METVETTETVEELSAEERNLEVASAHYTAQALTDQLHLVYWFTTRDDRTADYMRRSALETFKELTEKLLAAGIL